MTARRLVRPSTRRRRNAGAARSQAGDGVVIAVALSPATASLEPGWTRGGRRIPRRAVTRAASDPPPEKPRRGFTHQPEKLPRVAILLALRAGNCLREERDQRSEHPAEQATHDAPQDGPSGLRHQGQVGCLQHRDYRRVANFADPSLLPVLDQHRIDLLAEGHLALESVVLELELRRADNSVPLEKAL